MRQAIADIPRDRLVLVACSGGPDSLALAFAAAQEAAASGRRLGAVIVDHGLQADSAAVAERAAQSCRAAGLDPVDVLRVTVDGGGGPENAARDARRAAITQLAQRIDAAAVLLAHTRDDQAETVLLRLARGSGARTLSGMASVEGLWRRPLLDLPREVVHDSLGEMPVWLDPHNADRAYARTRVRLDALPALVDSLGPDVVDGLARSAALLRDDADALDVLADEAWQGARLDADGVELDVAALAGLMRAVRTRVLRRAAITAGASPAALTRAHTLALEGLISAWHGQGPLDLPGPVRASREYGRLSLRRVSGAGHDPQPPPAQGA